MSTEFMQAESVETTAVAEVTTDTTADVFDSNWDDDGLTVDDDMSLEADDATEEAEVEDQHEVDEETASVSEESEVSEEKKPEAEDQRFVLKHLDEQREVGRDEVIELAQKGMDYDRKVPMLQSKVADYEEFLKELCPPNASIEQMMDITRARLYRAKEARENRDISETDALLFVQQERAAKKAAAKAAAEEEAARAQTAKQQRSNESIQRFIAAYGNVDPKDIPQSVWDEANKDGDLLGAYTRYENKKLKNELEVLKQTEKNKARSTGSRKSQGATAAKDPFDAAWDSF